MIISPQADQQDKTPSRPNGSTCKGFSPFFACAAGSVPSHDAVPKVFGVPVVLVLGWVLGAFSPIDFLPRPKSDLEPPPIAPACPFSGETCDPEAFSFDANSPHPHGTPGPVHEVAVSVTVARLNKSK